MSQNQIKIKGSWKHILHRFFLEKLNLFGCFGRMFWPSLAHRHCYGCLLWDVWPTYLKGKL